jgi:D-arabinose 1-dehydrogenase-like Zn-dependent alcohol dehydrogenase
MSETFHGGAAKEQGGKFTEFDFCARHKIAPVTETFAMDDINSALDHLRADKARHRIVLKR